MLLPVLYALLLWWFTTGLIMVAYGRSPRFIRRWFVGATVVMLMAIGGLVLSARQTAPIDVYLAFTCGALIWGWHMASYYLGYVTGPMTTIEEQVTNQGRVWQQSEKHGKWQHFLFSQRFCLALQSGVYHELLVVGFAILLVMLTWAQPNRWGLWIFLTLWFMHSSAKLNVFLGVRNFRADFLPSHLHFLKQLLVHRASNEFFPISICLATSVLLILFYQILQPGAAAMQVIGATLVGTIILLGIIEHWLLVLPLPAVLWGWGIRALPDQQTHGPRPAVTGHNQNAPLQVIVVEQASEG